MESPREVRCMEFVALRRHGITRQCVSFLRIDSIQTYGLIPYRRQAADYIHGSAVICKVAILHPNTKVLVNQGIFVFLGVKNNSRSLLYFFLTFWSRTCDFMQTC